MRIKVKLIFIVAIFLTALLESLLQSHAQSPVSPPSTVSGNSTTDEAKSDEKNPAKTAEEKTTAAPEPDFWRHEESEPK